MIDGGAICFVLCLSFKKELLQRVFEFLDVGWIGFGVQKS